jgi:hypothetical protein
VAAVALVRFLKAIDGLSRLSSLARSAAVSATALPPLDESLKSSCCARRKTGGAEHPSACARDEFVSAAAVISISGFRSPTYPL